MLSCEREPTQINNWTPLAHGTNNFIQWANINNFPEVKSYAIELSKSRQLLRTENEVYYTLLEHIDAYIFSDTLGTTFTLPIQKVNHSEFGFSNLVIKYVNGHPEEEFILNYVPTQEYLNNYVDYHQTAFQGTVEYESIGNSVGRAQRFCQMVSNTYCCWSWGNECDDTHDAGPNCTPAFMWTETTLVCQEDPTTVIIDAGDGGGGGTGTGMEPNDNPHTTPIPPDTCENQRGDVGISTADGCLSSDSCIEPVEGDINLDCELSDYELCLLEQNNENICDCVLSGNSTDSCLFDENISINNLDNDCARLMIQNNLLGTSEGVYTNLLNDIRNIFFYDSDVTLFFRDDEDVPENALAATDFDEQTAIDNGTYNIIITVSENYLNNNPTKLSIALVLIHEMVHAKLIYSYLEGNLLAQYPQYTTLKESFDIFLENRSSENGQIALDESHKAMVDFIGQMSYSLFKYAERVGMNNIDHQYCTDIVKGSFYHTPAMEEINTGNSTAEDLRDKTYNEQENTENALGDDC